MTDRNRIVIVLVLDSPRRPLDVGSPDDPGGGAALPGADPPAQPPAPLRHVRGHRAGPLPVQGQPGHLAAPQRRGHPGVPRGGPRPDPRLPGLQLRLHRAGPGRHGQRLAGRLRGGAGRLHLLRPVLHPGLPGRPGRRGALAGRHLPPGGHGRHRRRHRAGAGPGGRGHGRPDRPAARRRGLHLRRRRSGRHVHPGADRPGLGPVPGIPGRHPGADRHRRRLRPGAGAGHGGPGRGPGRPLVRDADPVRAPLRARGHPDDHARGAGGAGRAHRAPGGHRQHRRPGPGEGPGPAPLAARRRDLQRPVRPGRARRPTPPTARTSASWPSPGSSACGSSAGRR